MKIISYEESRRILLNLRRKETLEKCAEQLRGADPEERSRILAQIECEVEDWVGQQIITGADPKVGRIMSFCASWIRGSYEIGELCKPPKSRRVQ